MAKKQPPDYRIITRGKSYMLVSNDSHLTIIDLRKNGSKSSLLLEDDKLELLKGAIDTINAVTE